MVYMDPDVSTSNATMGTSDRPYLHGLTINIPGTDVASGTAVTSYLGPDPPDGSPHYYYFLLYEQTGTLQLTNTAEFTDGSECVAAIADR